MLIFDLACRQQSHSVILLQLESRASELKSYGRENRAAHAATSARAVACAMENRWSAANAGDRRASSGQRSSREPRGGRAVDVRGMSPNMAVYAPSGRRGAARGGLSFGVLKERGFVGRTGGEVEPSVAPLAQRSAVVAISTPAAITSVRRVAAVTTATPDGGRSRIRWRRGENRTFTLM